MSTLLLVGCLVQLPITFILLYDWSWTKLHALRRFHIGRWNSEQEWKNAVLFCARRWIRRCPSVSAVDNSTYKLLTILEGKHYSRTIQSWQQAGLALGIMSSGNDKITKDLLIHWKEQYLHPDGSWKSAINKVDFAMLAYALLIYSDCPNHIRPMADQVNVLLHENLGDDGMISYSQGKESSIRYVDTLGMVCPFLAKYGSLFGSQEASDLAFRQIEQFRNKALYKGSNLPCHAYDFVADKPLGIYGWGRGTGWYVLAMVDTWREFPEGDKKLILQSWMLSAAEEYIYYQKADGAFYTILQGGGQYDSSVTALMAYFYSVCAEAFDSLRYTEVSRRCLYRIMKATMRDGAIDQCQGDTHGIGSFSQNYDIMPFVQGVVLRTLRYRDVL